MQPTPIFYLLNQPSIQWIRAQTAILLIALSLLHLTATAQGVRPETVTSGLKIAVRGTRTFAVRDVILGQRVKLTRTT